MKRAPLLVLPVVLLALAGCGSSPKTSTSTSASSSAGAGASQSSAGSSSRTAAPTGGSVAVSMKNLAFIPQTVHAKVGQTIVWTNNDTPPHNVTYVSGPKFTSSSTLNPGATFKLKLTQAGTISYYCTIHPFMKATIVVSP